MNKTFDCIAKSSTLWFKTSFTMFQSSIGCPNPKKNWEEYANSRFSSISFSLMMEKLTFHSQAKNVFLAALNFCGFSVSCCERLLQKILFKPNLFRSSFIFIDLFYTLHSSIFTFTFQTKFTIYVKEWFGIWAIKNC